MNPLKDAKSKLLKYLLQKHKVEDNFDLNSTGWGKNSKKIHSVMKLK